MGRTYTDDMIWTDDEGVTVGHAAMQAKATETLAGTPDWTFTKDGEVFQTRGLGHLGWQLALRRRTCGHRYRRGDRQGRSDRAAVHRGRRLALMSTASRKSDTWLTPSQQRTWLAYMRVYHRLEYEMNSHLQSECGMSLGDYTVMNALSNSPGQRLQLTSLATVIGWERSRLSHQLLRMTKRGQVDRVRSDTDGRATDAVLTASGLATLKTAAPKHVAWVRRLFFADLDHGQEAELADILSAVYETILRNGTLPRPDEPFG